MRDRRVGLLFCLTAAGGFSTVGILAKLAYAAHVNLVTLLAGRFLLTSILLWLLVAATRQSIPSGRTLIAGLALGVIGFGLQVTLLFLSLERIDAALSSLLFYSYPAIVTVGAVLIGREQVTIRRVSALGISLAGVGLVFSGGTARRDILGVLLSLASAFLYALIILAVDRLGRRTAPLALSAVVSTGAATTFLLSGFALRNLQLNLDPYGWGTIIGLAVVTAVPLAAFYQGIAVVGPSTASILLTVEPALTVVLAALVLSERLGTAQLLGGGLILSAVVLLQSHRPEPFTLSTST